MILAVICYQLFFVFILWFASRYGERALIIVTILCLLWTLIHLFILPLAILQTLVILFSARHFYMRIKKSS